MASAEDQILRADIPQDHQGVHDDLRSLLARLLLGHLARSREEGMAGWVQSLERTWGGRVAFPSLEEGTELAQVSAIQVGRK